MRYLRVTNRSEKSQEFCRRYVFTSVENYLEWDKAGFSEACSEFGITLTDDDIKSLAARVEWQLPANFCADSERQTFKFVTKEPLAKYSDCDDFQAFYNLIIDTMFLIFDCN